MTMTRGTLENPQLPAQNSLEPSRSVELDRVQKMPETVDVSVRGEWHRVPALNVDGTNIIVTGSWLKTAIIHDEEWLEGELQDPEICIRRLKERSSHKLRADIFTFCQKIPATTPKYSFPLEWDSIAAVRVTTFKDWWEKL